MPDLKSDKEKDVDTDAAAAADEVQTNEAVQTDEPKKKNGRKEKAKAKPVRKDETVSKKDFDKLSGELADALSDNLDLRDRYMRTLAEFENFKKRSLRDLSRSLELETEKILLNFLPVADDLDRALNHARTEKDPEKLPDGIERVKNKFIQVLKGFDVEPFESAGEHFDPERHDALMTRVEADKDEDMVLEEFEKGFVRGDRVIRHAKVIVSKKD